VIDIEITKKCRSFYEIKTFVSRDDSTEIAEEALKAPKTYFADI